MLNPTTIFSDYYVLQFLKIKHNDPIAANMLNDLLEKAVPAFVDYNFAVSLGEARHAPHQCDDYALDPTTFPYTSETSRYTVYQNAHRYDIKQCLPVLYDLFYNCYWDDDYGGGNWATIVKVTLDYLEGRDTPTMFLERCIGIEHNNGCYLDKNYIFALPDEEELAWLMDNARNDEIGDYFEYMYCSQMVVDYVKSVKEYRYKYGVPNHVGLRPGVFDIGYQPVQYGDLEIYLIDKDEWDRRYREQIQKKLESFKAGVNMDEEGSKERVSLW